jgi:DNA-binding response OmpR family regulator
MKSVIRLRVLYADDDEDAGLMLSTLLNLSNIEVQTVKSVVEALRVAHSKSFDLYLLDTRFPDGSGFELCRRLREFNSSTPIVFYSGEGFEKDKAKGLAAGANAYLVKPNCDHIAPIILRLIK